ncbi:predicted protein [Naegleria gruberi]|uniref:Predicted protein n=1 Tax=Naegleria gruberi TaxID=5762 RepID=D2VFH2_NAEGR|nr:uncharacterized protein NAEGRDRAFT_67626 [Naegleria gruberi]EFC44464.1 predicted protein [Naegleria gruberi]|eukprot:XP_002677208.1 predicted protein [Naegleria gruberi strain NEG-M]
MNEFQTQQALQIAESSTSTTLSMEDAFLTQQFHHELPNASQALILENIGFKRKKKQILSDISCTIPSGQLTMIIGGSGGGKSSLLDIISKRVRKGCSGTITFKGQPLTKKLFHKQGGYVYQDDILLSTDTIHEILLESSLLKYKHKEGNKLSDIWKMCSERTFQVENDIGLYPHRNVKIGTEQKKGASGGQKKRTSLSIQLINNPDLLLLDEYSSGLDSYTSLEIGKKLQRLAHEQGKTIVATVHQPSSELFGIFDNVILLAKGKLVYCGPVSQVKSYLKKIDYPIPEDTNPADFLISIVSDPYLRQEKSMTSSVSEAVVAKSGSCIEICIDNDGEKTMEQQLEIIQNRIDLLSSFYKSKYNSSQTSTGSVLDNPLTDSDERRNIQSILIEGFLKLLVLTYRNLRSTFRDPLLVLSELVQAVFLGLFCGLLYFKLSADQQGITDRISALFFLVTCFAIVPATSVVSTFPQQRLLFTRERESNLYSTLTYYTSYTIVHIPVEAIFPIVNLICAYWLVGFQNNPGNFFIFCAIMILVQWLSESIGLFIGALCESVGVGNLILSVVITIWMSFSGFLIRNTQIGGWFYPFSYTSLFRYSVHALAQAELSGMSFECSSTNKILSTVNMTDICSFRNGTSIPINGSSQISIEPYTEQLCSELNWNQTVATLTSSTCFKSGEDALNYYFEGSNHIPIWGNVLILFGMLIIMRIAIYLALRFKRWDRK